MITNDSLDDIAQRIIDEGLYARLSGIIGTDSVNSLFQRVWHDGIIPEPDRQIFMHQNFDILAGNESYITEIKSLLINLFETYADVWGERNHRMGIINVMRDNSDSSSVYARGFEILQIDNSTLLSNDVVIEQARKSLSLLRLICA